MRAFESPNMAAIVTLVSSGRLRGRLADRLDFQRQLDLVAHQHPRRRRVGRVELDGPAPALEAAAGLRDHHVPDGEVDGGMAGVDLPGCHEVVSFLKGSYFLFGSTDARWPAGIRGVRILPWP